MISNQDLGGMPRRKKSNSREQSSLALKYIPLSENWELVNWIPLLQSLLWKAMQQQVQICMVNLNANKFLLIPCRTCPEGQVRHPRVSFGATRSAQPCFQAQNAQLSQCSAVSGALGSRRLLPLCSVLWRHPPWHHPSSCCPSPHFPHWLPGKLRARRRSLGFGGCS